MTVPYRAIGQFIGITMRTHTPPIHMDTAIRVTEPKPYPTSI